MADYDADGDPDVYVTRYGRNTLWRNDREEGRFTDVTEEAGVGCGSWSLGAAFGDFDQDGDLDLFVANYFVFDQAKAPFRRDPVTGAADYGLPQDFAGLPDVLYRNEGNGRFKDVTKSAGVAGSGRGMGVLASDFDGDGRIDWLVANDAESNALWRNRGDGTFEDLADPLGLAVNGQGLSEANMGIAFGDTDGDTLPDVLISHFYNEHTTLWRAPAARKAASSIKTRRARPVWPSIPGRSPAGEWCWPTWISTVISTCSPPTAISATSRHSSIDTRTRRSSGEISATGDLPMSPRTPARTSRHSTWAVAWPAVILIRTATSTSSSFIITSRASCSGTNRLAREAI